jgi:hypothetical protein
LITLRDMGDHDQAKRVITNERISHLSARGSSPRRNRTDGDVGEFRAGLMWLDLPYAVGIHSTTTVTPLGTNGHERDTVQVAKLAASLPKKALRSVTCAKAAPGRSARDSLAAVYASATASRT